MAVYKDKNERWHAVVDMGRTIDGKRDRRTKLCKTQVEAIRAEQRLQIERDGFTGHTNRVSFREFTEEYYLPMKRASLRKNTVRVYESAINNYLIPRFGNMNIQAISRAQIQSMISSCRTKKIATNARDALRQILGEALQMGLVQTNIAAGRFRFPPPAKRKEPDWITDIKEHQRIISLAQGEVRIICVLGYCFGLRKEEILGLDRESIDFDKMEIRIEQAFPQCEDDVVEPKTENSIRTIPITEYAKSELVVLLEGVESGPILTRYGRRMTTHRAGEIIERFRESPEVPYITIKSMRHSFASAAILSGVPIPVVSRWLGHCDIATTLKSYVRPLQSDLKNAADMLDKLYNGT